MKHRGLRGSCITRYFFLMGFYVTGVNSLSATLNQTPLSGYKLVGQTIEISCFVKGESMEKLGLYWYRQTEKNGGMEFIVSAPSQLAKFSYGSGIDQNKFIMKRPSIQSYFTLMITRLEYSDSGVYYCMAGASLTYTFGEGTHLAVVNSLPTTVKPTTTKPPNKSKKQKTSKTSPPGVSCSAVVWAPLTGLALGLLIGLYLLASHTYRVYRRTHMYFRKQITGMKMEATSAQLLLLSTFPSNSSQQPDPEDV